MECTVKHKIITKATELFMKFGFKCVTVDEVAKQTGISKKTLYENITDKDELVLLSMKQHMEAMRLKFMAICKPEKNALTEMLEVMEQMQQDMCEMNPVGPIDLQRYYPQTHVFLQEFTRNEMVGLIKDNLQKGIQQQLYRSNINIDITAIFRIESIFTIINTGNKTNAELAKFQHEINIQFLYGISTIKGFKLLDKHLQPSL